METILFDGNEYPTRLIANGTKIATISLYNMLTTKDGDFVSDEAELTDCFICGYVDDEELNLPAAELEQLCRDYGIIE